MMDLRKWQPKNVWFQKISIPPPPHRGSWKFQGVEGCERGTFPKGSRVHKELSFYRGFDMRLNKTLKYMLCILYFKDCTVFSLNATGAFSDGIIHAVS